MKAWLGSLLLILGAAECWAAVTITTTRLPNGTVGSVYSASVQASGGCTPYRWAVTSGSLPGGITKVVSSTTTSLKLSGTPKTAAAYAFTVAATGCGGHVSSVSYKIAIQATTATVRITTSTLPNAIVGHVYSAAVKASGGCTPYKWSIASGALPAGITATTSSSTTSLNLGGTPKTAATYAPVVQVTGCGGGTIKASYKIVIQATPNHVVDLSWTASISKNISGYNMYRSPDGATWKRVNASLIASTLYTDSKVANATTYYYAATAVDIYGHESRKTPIVKAIVP